MIVCNYNHHALHSLQHVHRFEVHIHNGSHINNATTIVKKRPHVLDLNFL